MAQHAAAIDILADYRSLCTMDLVARGLLVLFGVMLANSIESTQQDLELLESIQGGGSFTRPRSTATTSVK